MRALKITGIIAGFLIFYFAFGFFAQYFLPQPLIVTVLADVVVGVFGFYYYFTHFRQRDVIMSLRRGLLFGSGQFVFMVFIWFVSQITSAWYYMSFGDRAFDVYTNATTSNAALYFVLALVIAPFFEEVLMRGIVYNQLKTIMPIWVSCIVSAFVFAAMHGTAVHLFIGFIGGIFFTLVYEHTHRLRYAMLFHCLYNFISLSLGGMTLPDWLFHPAVFVPLDLIVGSVFILLFVLIGKRDSLLI